MRFETLQEAIDRVNRTDYGLAASIFTDNIDDALTFAHNVRTGILWYFPSFKLFKKVVFKQIKSLFSGSTLTMPFLHILPGADLNNLESVENCNQNNIII